MPTSDSTFFDRLRERVRVTGGVLAVGLNPDPARLPDDCGEYDYPRRAFNRRIIDATHEDAAAYTVNPAFYEDSSGWTALAETVAYAHGQGVPVVVDGKWIDAPAGSARADLLDRADAATVSPFCGRDALDRDSGAFVVCRTPNRGAADLQDREIAGDSEGADGTEADETTDESESLAQRVATLAGEWADDAGTADVGTADVGTADVGTVDARTDVGLLVGGPSDDLEALRAVAPDLPFLVVGGATNDPEVAEFAVAEEGQAEGIGLVEVSREVIYAGETAGRRGGASGMDNYAAAARQSARRLKRQLNRHR